ncbi:MAG: CoA transferase [Alphaproteobacteria bacterium]|nr:CoA transferase [Alphaproteobacteria bacterium]
MNLGLLNLRVVESSAFIAAPLAGLTLAQFGADVIHIDNIGGGIDYGRLPLMPSGRSLYWTSLNKAKRSIAIDLRRPEGRELVQALVTAPGENAGILLTNIVSKWLDHAALAKTRPDLITCMIEGNQDGTTAVDYTVNAATGYPAMTGPGSIDAPVNHVLPAWDIACAFQAALAISAAADRRRRTGVGAELRLALSDVAFTMLSHLGLATEAQLLGEARPSLGNHIYGAFGRDFATADGKRIMVAGISAAQWTTLVKSCGIEAEIAALEARLGKRFVDESDRFDARDAIAELVAGWCLARTLAEIRPTFDANRVCWGPYRTTPDLMANDARVGPTNPVWEQLDPAGIGPHRAAGTPVRAPAEPRGAMTPAPLLGQHTDDILLGVLGLSGAAVGKLHDSGVVAGPDKDPTGLRDL